MNQVKRLRAARIDELADSIETAKTCYSSDEEVELCSSKLDLHLKSERAAALEAKNKEVQLRRPGIAKALQYQSLKNQKNTGLR